MTREELKKIVFKTHSPLTVEEVMFGIDKYVEQIRAEVIDECIAKIDREHTHSAYNDDVYEAIMLLKQLKEQK